MIGTTVELMVYLGGGVGGGGGLLYIALENIECDVDFFCVKINSNKK